MTALDRTWLVTTCGGRADYLARILPGWTALFGRRIVVVCHNDTDAVMVAQRAGVDWLNRRGRYFHAARARNFGLARAADLAWRAGYSTIAECPLAPALFFCVDCDTACNDPDAVGAWLEQVDKVGIGWLGRRPDRLHPSGLAGLVAAHLALAREVGGYAERLTGYGFEDIAFRRMLIARVRREPAWLRHDAVGHLRHNWRLRRARYAPGPDASQRINRRRWLEWEHAGRERPLDRQLSGFCSYNPPYFE